MLNKQQIRELVIKLYNECKGNMITEDFALVPEIVGTKIFDEPIMGFGSAQDSLFDEYLEVGKIGPWFMKPEKWLPGAKSVVSVFFPFSEEVKNSNRSCTEGPSAQWLHGRIEGQAFVSKFSIELRDALMAEGIKACAPAVDERFKSVSGGNNFREYPQCNEKTFGSNWSERHAAFVCGLGTFGLSKGLITKKGMAGRFASVIIDLELEADERPYKEVYEYCTKCGACVKRCPVNAISLENGKDHMICGPWMRKTAEMYAPRYGCGLCQTKVPCESCIPRKQ
ncbi:MAG: 4Fe-4S binding protein [Oscillospiraceae bacterium]|nr:4Fe-4S binding protein [Oscillospiraceae bacterium]